MRNKTLRYDRIKPHFHQSVSHAVNVQRVHDRELLACLRRYDAMVVILGAIRIEWAHGSRHRSKLLLSINEILVVTSRRVADIPAYCSSDARWPTRSLHRKADVFVTYVTRFEFCEFPNFYVLWVYEICNCNGSLKPTFTKEPSYMDCNTVIAVELRETHKTSVALSVHFSYFSDPLKIKM